MHVNINLKIFTITAPVNNIEIHVDVGSGLDAP